jgi:integrase
MPSYIQKRRRRWYAVLEVPRDLRPRMGKVRFVKSLETDSPTIAQRRIGPIVAAWLSELDRARAGGGEPAAGDAAYFRRALRAATSEEHRGKILRNIEEAADDIGAVHVANVGQLPSSDSTAQRFYAEATGALVPTLEHLDEWIATRRKSPKTQAMARSDVQRFAAKLPMLQEVQRPAVRRWATSLMHDDNLAPTTVQRILSAVRGYWRYLQAIGVVGEDQEPFAKLDVARHAKDRGASERRQAFEPADVVRLLREAVEREDSRLADLIHLAMFTGARIEELCALKVADVNGDSFRVVASKTAAGVRVVPIHAELAATMARLVESSRDGYVMSGLPKDKYGVRSNAIGKRFGKLRSAVGFGPQFVFHSIRKTVVTILENEGVSENIVADLVGHEKPRITYGLYSGGTTLEVKRAALARLVYPASSEAATGGI